MSLKASGREALGGMGRRLIEAHERGIHALWLARVTPLDMQSAIALFDGPVETMGPNTASAAANVRKHIGFSL